MLSPEQGAGIDRLLADMGAENLELSLRLSWRLRPLVQRGVPPRAVEAGPAAHAARLRFGDGTTVIVKGNTPGDVGVLAVAVQRCSVKPTACTTTPEGSTQILFTWPGRRHSLWLRVLGLDQPD